MKETGKNLSELASCIKEWPQVLFNIDVCEKKRFEDMPGVYAKIKDVEARLQGKGRLLLRYSGTQNVCRIMIEGQNNEEITQMANEIKDEIIKEVGA